jgi:hypothetical protein
VLAAAALDGFLQGSMTGKTDIVLFFHDHPADVAAVGVVAGETLTRGERHVVDPPGLFFHDVAMTLFAEFGTRGFQALLNVGTMGIMTCIALGICHRLMGIIPRKVTFRRGMAGEADRIHPAFQDAREIRTVGIMTGCAHIRVERHMGVLVFLRFFRFCMTGKTEFAGLCQKQFLVLGGMGGMAGQAAFTSRDRGVGNCALFSFVGMAAEADRVAGTGKELGVL